MIVVIEKNANGKIEFTQEELEELLEKAKQEGVAIGQKYQYVYTTPTSPAPTLNPCHSPFTCSKGTIATSNTTDAINKLNGAPITNGI